MLILLRSIWLLTALHTNVQVNDVDYGADLRMPMNITPILAGNFGEIRPNHFHTGLDLKTNGKEGYRIYSVGDGYVSRIRVNSFGYGKVLYINHPQYGITSVYAHCQDFSGAIAEYTFAAQKAAEFFEIDIDLEPYAVPVKKGEIIAISGNTGGSTAPHLHFEIREMANDNPLNPELFDFMNQKVADKRPPEIRGLKVYALSAKGYRIPGLEMLVSVKNMGKSYNISHNELEVPAHFCSEHGGIGFALNTIDKYDGAENVCGIYHGTLTVNGDTIHQQTMSRIDFDFTRQINMHKDYESYNAKKGTFEKYFRTPQNQIPIYDTLRGKGVIGVQPDHDYHIQFAISDNAKNQSFLSFLLRVAAGDLRQENTPYDTYHADYMYPDSAYQFSNSNCKLSFPKGGVYEPVEKILTYKRASLIFGDYKTPVQYYYDLSLAIPEDLKAYQSKIIMKQLDNSSYYFGEVKKDFYKASVRSFGTFTLDIDTIAPILSPKNFKNNSVKKSVNRLTWNISDDKSGLAYYALWINGVWQLLEYEHKRKEVFADISSLDPGKHEMRVVVRDRIGNEIVEVFELHIIG